MTRHVGDLLWREVRVHSHIPHVVTSQQYGVVAMGKVGLREGGRSWTISPPSPPSRFQYNMYVRTYVFGYEPLAAYSAGLDDAASFRGDSVSNHQPLSSCI